MDELLASDGFQIFIEALKSYLLQAHVDSGRGARDSKQAVQFLSISNFFLLCVSSFSYLRTNL